VRPSLRTFGLLAAVCVHVASATAYAHPKVDEARQRLEAAEFDAALRLLAEAEAGSELTREDALRLLELRALVHLALNEDEAAVETLRVLAVLSPEHALPPQTSPDLVAALKRARESAPAAPRLVVERALLPDGVRVSAAVEDDQLGVARSLRLWTRIAGQPWRSTLATETLVAAAPGQRVEYRADALGIGGAPVLSSEPGSLLVPAGRERVAAEGVGGTSPWLYAGVLGGALAVGGAVAMIVLLGQSDGSSTQLSPPMVVQR
jgi:hypothetical protein